MSEAFGGFSGGFLEIFTIFFRLYSIVWKQNPGFLTRFCGSGIFLGRIFGDFWRIFGAIFGGFLGRFRRFFLYSFGGLGGGFLEDFPRIFLDRIFLGRIFLDRICFPYNTVYFPKIFLDFRSFS